MMWKKVGAAALMLVTAWSTQAQTDWRNQAIPAYSVPTFVRMQDTHWYAPRVVEFVRRVEALKQTLDAHCDGNELVIPVRQAWRDTLTAWDRLGTVAIGPLVERRTARRLDFQPARAELIEQAIGASAQNQLDMDQVGSAARGLPALEWLLWSSPYQPAARQSRRSRPAASARATARAKAKAKASAKSPSKPKASAKGKRAEVWIELPQFAGSAQMLEQLALHLPEGFVQVSLKTTKKPAAKTNAKPGKSSAKPAARRAAKPNRARNTRGRAARVLAAPPPPGWATSGASRTAQPGACRFAQALVADMHAEAMALAEGFAKRIEAPGDERVMTERLTESLNQWVGGLEQLRMQALERPVLDMAPNNPRARPRLPRQLSGASALDRQARWSALRTLAVSEGLATPAPDTGLISIETLLRSQGRIDLADKLEEAAKEVDRTLEESLPNTPESLQAASRALATLGSLVSTEVAKALGVSMGFSDADGD
ncbi:hypothetical protein VITFI_CDS0364 [Vitreoscilla filiformis]|uniref:Imelysin-like domain-containing protein n=2 Tax=Vitreoscilla filiformis TaxID=63 RepID=A0A221KBE2_VITFI|nr:hypothetical protein VITFI_CDS0364 [Vitreoscilla filiformis]